jgi:hypothetical protein
MYNEFFRSLKQCDWTDKTPVGAWLAHRGMTPLRRFAVGGVGSCTAALDDRSHTYVPYPDGDRVMVMPVFDGPVAHVVGDDDESPDLTDMIAWRPAAPERLYRRTGAADLVGIGGIDAAIETGLPLRVFRRAMDFIAHGGEEGRQSLSCGIHGITEQLRPACLILDVRRSGALLAHVRSIIPDDRAHGRDIDAAIRASFPQAPQILWPDHV